MKLTILAAVIVGSLVALQSTVRAPRSLRGAISRDATSRDDRRDERGLSQSAETAILLAGAVVVAGIVVTVITAFVKSKLPK